MAARAAGSLLLETARRDHGSARSLLFLDPVEELVAWNAGDLETLLQEVDRHTIAGSYVAGYFAYECGEYFVGLPPRETSHPSASGPLAWLGVYRRPVAFDHRTGVFLGELPEFTEEEVASTDTPLDVNGLEISKPAYNSRFARIQEHLAAGDTYQVNFTDRITGTLRAKPLEVYSTLLEQQPVGFAAFLHRPIGPILSFSPELFYSRTADAITVRPMKGTWARGRDLDEDRAAAEQLCNDEKNRSEHIMIVDLLRNDLGKVSEMGSVHVDKLFDVERYTTLLQMTSTITARLRPGVGQSSVFRALFPSGSITGAPKRKTMEIIRELESAPRGIYTGAIGYFGPNQEACFNVAIRTMDIRGDRFSMGVGGGITADSRAEDEFKECEMKASFLTKRDRPFALIETMRCLSGIPLLQGHLQRLAAAAAYFDIAYDAEALQRELQMAAMACGDVESRVRMELNLDGSWQIASSPMDSRPWSGRLLLASERTRSNDIFLHHKTTNREFYNQHLAAAAAAGFDEALFLNEQDQLTEGAIQNVFVEIDGVWLTPSLTCGVLPGVKRAEILRLFLAVREAEISLAEIESATAIIVCNALRGVRSVRSIETADGAVIWRAGQQIDLAEAFL